MGSFIKFILFPDLFSEIKITARLRITKRTKRTSGVFGAAPQVSGAAFSGAHAPLPLLKLFRMLVCTMYLALRKMSPIIGLVAFQVFTSPFPSETSS